MPNMLFANNCNTTLSSSLTNVATTMSVTSATGFPVPTGSQYFYCTLADAATQTTIEIVKVTAVSGTTFTIVRGQDGTSGTAFASGAVVSLRLVSASLNDFPKLDENNTFTYAPTFNTALSVGSGGTGTATAFTTGSVIFAGASGVYSQNNANFFWDNTNKYLGIGTASPIYAVHANGTVASSVASGTAPTLLLNQSGVGAATILMPASSSALTFNIFNGGTGTLVERMRMFDTGGVSIGNTTDPGAGNLSVTGKIFSNTTNSTAQINVNGSIGIYNGAGTYSLDTSPTGTTIASLGTVNYPNASGVLIVNNWSIGGVGIFTCGGGGTTLITGSNVGALAYNPSINGYTWTNTAVSAYVYDFMFIRTRSNA